MWPRTEEMMNSGAGGHGRLDDAAGRGRRRPFRANVGRGAAGGVCERAERWPVGVPVARRYRAGRRALGHDQDHLRPRGAAADTHSRAASVRRAGDPRRSGRWRQRVVSELGKAIDPGYTKRRIKKPPMSRAPKMSVARSKWSSIVRRILAPNSRRVIATRKKRPGASE